jgi:hypothetical protein
LPNCSSHARGPFDVSGLSKTDLTRNSDASADHPDSSVHSEGRTENRGGKLPLVTSALSKQLRFPLQGSDRQLPDGTSVSEGAPDLKKGSWLTGPGDRREMFCRLDPSGSMTVLRFKPPVLDRGYVLRPLDERRTQWNDRRMRIFAWNTPRFEQEEVSLRDQVRNWEQDEARKMEQERREHQAHGRGESGLDKKMPDQVEDTDHSNDAGKSDQDQMIQERREDTGKEELNTRRSILGIQEKETLGEVTYDRTSGTSRSSSEIDHQ